MNLRASTGLVALTVAAVVAFSGAATAQAAYPGQNGKIAFSDTRDDPSPSTCNPNCNSEIYTINPDGTGFTRLTNNPAADGSPSWSPDGSKIAFHRVVAGGICRLGYKTYVMNADGTGQTPLDCGAYPSWSPDGTKIAFTLDDHCDGPPSDDAGLFIMNADGTGTKSFVSCGGGTYQLWPAWSPAGDRIVFGAIFQLYAVDVDGSDLTRLTFSDGGFIDRSPDWAPNAGKVVFDRVLASPNPDGIYTMNPDGSGQALLRANAIDPAYSPDGRKLAFVAFVDGSGVWTANADNTGATFLTAGREPDWQPILKGYARPKAATPIYTSLVPAYEPCAAPNRTHAAPLAFDSCNPPAQTSDHATVGTPDANTQPAKSVASLRLVAIGELPIDPNNGNQSDLVIEFSYTDLRQKATPAADYTAGLRVKAALQITDRNNTPYPGGPGPGTVVPISFEFDSPCTATPDTTVGATCATSTTANALVPGQVLERQRAIWQLGRVEVDDGGADANPATEGDNTLFATQGIFVP